MNNKLLTGVLITFIAGSVGVRTYQILKSKVQEENEKSNLDKTEGPQ